MIELEKLADPTTAAIVPLDGVGKAVGTTRLIRFRGGRAFLRTQPVVLMIENYRSGLCWNIMRCSPPTRAGLQRTGFSGGWLWSFHHTIREAAGIMRYEDHEGDGLWPSKKWAVFNIFSVSEIASHFATITEGVTE
jgi:hypothetical protein